MKRKLKIEIGLAVLLLLIALFGSFLILQIFFQYYLHKNLRLFLYQIKRCYFYENPKPTQERPSVTIRWHFVCFPY